MIIDKNLQVSTAQALTGSATSTDVIDLGVDRGLFAGRQMWFVIACKTAMGGTSPTFNAAVQTDDNSGFSSATARGGSQTYSTLAAGDIIAIPIPWINERYLRLNYTMAGTSPTLTVDAWLTDQEPPKWQSYPDALTP